MPTSPLKRPSGGGGRLRRLLASLRPLPVQTGFPTSLADIVVKNHGRLRNTSKRRHRAAPPPAAEQRRELSVAHDAAAPAVPVPPRRGEGAVDFSIRPGLLAAGGAVALALLVIWSKQLVAAATIVSVALSWIENVRTVRPRRLEAVESPRPGRGECLFESDDGGSDAASLSSADADSGDLGCDDDTSSSVNNPKKKQSRRRSLRKLLASKLRNGSKTPPRGTDSRHGSDAGDHEHERTETTPRRVNAERPAAAAAPAEETPRQPEAITADDGCLRRHGRALPLPALVPIILAGLVAGKLPALALAVLCVAFSSSVDTVPEQARSR